MEFFYVEAKKRKEKRYGRVIFHSENLEDCFEYIRNNKEKGTVYRIVDSSNQFRSKPIYG